MKTVWKFKVDMMTVVRDDFIIDMPRGAKILSVQTDTFEDSGLQFCIWALVDSDAPEEARKFAIRGTGRSAEGLEEVPFLGTVQMHREVALVFHLWDGWPVREKQVS